MFPGRDDEHRPPLLSKLNCFCSAVGAGGLSSEEAGVELTTLFLFLPVVLQGSLHLEDVGAALQPGRQLELLVQVWLVLQDLWGRRALAQPEL